VIATHVAHVDIADSAALQALGLASLARTGAVIRAQLPATRSAVRAALDRRAKAHATPAGLRSPVAFKVGSGVKR
jgi:hypothetical protein